MLKKEATRSAKIRSSLNHPVIDADGHYLELEPVFLDYMHQVAGHDMVRAYRERQATQTHNWLSMSWQERRDTWARVHHWWAFPAENTLDRATAHFPKLLAERMDDFGIDFCILYPTYGLTMLKIEETELRQAACRALNTAIAEMYGEYSERMTPAALIPMDSPEEAVRELDHAVRALGLKAILMPAYVERPIPAFQRRYPELATTLTRFDTYGLDSAHDYDPVWTKCLELGVAPTTHDPGLWGGRRSISNFMHNHIGHFAASAEALCRGLFMGGVTKRFPALKFGFQECGVSWACGLYADLIGHWEKRNKDVVEMFDPARIDRDYLLRLTSQYGDERVHSNLPAIRDLYEREQPRPPSIDDWAACRIERAEDIRDLFVPHFYFGCEADDRMATLAFNTKVNPFGARLNVMMGSDISHWDAPDMTSVVSEAHELVEKGLLDDAEFRDFMFTNPVRFYAGTNHSFFDGTRVGSEAAIVLREESH